MNNAEIQTGDRFPGALSVTQLNEYVKRLIETTPQLGDVYVKGEISNFKNHYATGHFYFTLKDETSQIRAVMFKSSASKMKFMPEDGMKVTAHGRISSFVRDGTYQLYADSMEPDGIGSLYIAFEQLKRKLEREGLFDQSRKKPLPKIPTRVGIITSATGAAIRDMINVCGRRFPYAKLVLFPSLVQGPDAPPQLIAGLNYFNMTRSVDVIIIGRGGGSIEDLWAFNDEGVARAVAASAIPVISAVGHETDFTICDFAADKRAPTPSAAAELAVPDTAELKHKINNIISRESAVLLQMLSAKRETLARYEKSRYLSSPGHMIDDRRMALVLSSERLMTSAAHVNEIKKHALSALSGKLEALSPLAVLSRGYGVVSSEEGKVIKEIADVSVGDKITVKVRDGEIYAGVSGTVAADTSVSKK